MLINIFSIVICIKNTLDLYNYLSIIPKIIIDCLTGKKKF